MSHYTYKISKKKKRKKKKKKECQNVSRAHRFFCDSVYLKVFRNCIRCTYFVEYNLKVFVKFSAEASSKYPPRKAISFHPLHIKGLKVSFWRPLNGQTFRPGCQVRMWILHIKIQDGVQNGRQKDEFSNFSHIGVKDLHKYTHFYVVLLRSSL